MAKLVTWENETYSSVLAAATAAGVAPNTMKRWLAKGYTSKAQAIAAPCSKLKGYAKEARERGVTRQAVHAAVSEEGTE